VVKTRETLRVELQDRLAVLRRRVAHAPELDATVVVIPRHGHATTRVNIESLYAHCDRPLRVVVVDVA
jgi:hypothetical protein